MHEPDLMLSEGLLETRGCDALRSRVCERILQLGRSAAGHTRGALGQQKPERHKQP
jgi:hypothetical protein